MISHYPISKCHSKLIINKFILMTSLFVLTLSGFFLNLNISCSFLLVSLSKVSSLTLCIYYTTLVVESQWF
ncbi:Putative phage protein [Streptococcus pneumoniae SPN994038]|nr:Putative phage protein [Streptococcus pneumoniae OXC141]CCP29802.1 Putative phage protein [Streptococcus pneumoniae SPN994038]CCP31776.1 Putative phage protein [Streptococcus pneumoniae SPN034183]CCP33761.1 Putative phage protein [Streptococcus pneumoniae SPN994039]